MLVADKLILESVGLGYPLELQTPYKYGRRNIVTKVLYRRTVSHSVQRFGEYRRGENEFRLPHHTRSPQVCAHNRGIPLEFLH